MHSGYAERKEYGLGEGKCQGQFHERAGWDQLAAYQVGPEYQCEGVEKIEMGFVQLQRAH